MFFLDYLAVGKVVPERVAALVEVAEGCRRAGCALLGGETAEHPGTMPDDAFDLAGFCIGAVDEASLLRPQRATGRRAGRPGLEWAARERLLARAPRPPRPPRARRRAARAGGRTIADELLEPCAIYAPDVLALARDGLVRAAAITGGGVHENLPRSLPDGLGARIDRGSWPEPPIVGLVRDAAGATDEDMFGTGNMGLGMVLAVDPHHADEVLARSGAAGLSGSARSSRGPASGSRERTSAAGHGRHVRGTPWPRVTDLQSPPPPTSVGPVGLPDVEGFSRAADSVAGRTTVTSGEMLDETVPATPLQTVLVVDDEPQVVWVLQFSLEAEGYTTYAGEAARGARRDLRAPPPPRRCSTS